MVGHQRLTSPFRRNPTKNKTTDMLNEQTQSIDETPNEFVEAIVRAAYKKFARDRLTRKAVRLSLRGGGERQGAKVEGAAL